MGSNLSGPDERIKPMSSGRLCLNAVESRSATTDLQTWHDHTAVTLNRSHKASSCAPLSLSDRSFFKPLRSKIA